MKASLSATFIDERFNIFQKVYFEAETSLGKEAPNEFYFLPTPKVKIANLEKTRGRFRRGEAHISRFDYSEVNKTGNLAQVSIL